FITTLLPLHTWSAPSRDFKPKDSKSQAPSSPQNTPSSATVTESLQISQPKGPSQKPMFSSSKTKTKEKAKDWSRITSLSMLYGSGIFDTDEKKKSLLRLGVLHSHYDKPGRATEYGGTLTNQNLLSLHAGYKKMLFSRSDF